VEAGGCCQLIPRLAVPPVTSPTSLNFARKTGMQILAGVEEGLGEGWGKGGGSVGVGEGVLGGN
jgi:hypothetical protein